MLTRQAIELLLNLYTDPDGSPLFVEPPGIRDGRRRYSEFRYRGQWSDLFRLQHQTGLERGESPSKRLVRAVGVQ
jgi:hypothetical protein